MKHMHSQAFSDGEYLNSSGVIVPLVAAVYAAAAWVSFTLRIEPGNIAPIFPSAGIALAAVLILGRRAMAGVLAGAILASMIAHFHEWGSFVAELSSVWPFALANGIGAMAGAGAGAHFVRRFSDDEYPLSSGRNVVKLIAIGAFGACMINPTIGTVSLTWGGLIPWGRFGHSWLTWWVGDVSGVIVAAPLILAWYYEHSLRENLRDKAEAAGQGAVLILLCYVVFFRNAPFEYGLIPLLLWAAFRFGMRGASSAAAVIAILATIGTSLGSSTFASDAADTSLLLLFSFLSVTITCALYLAGVLAERNRAKESLHESKEQFKSLVHDMQVGVLLQGPSAEIFLCNPKALELLGISEEQLLGKTSFDPDWNVIHEDGSDFSGSEHPVPRAIATRRPVQKIVMGVNRPLTGDRAWLLVDAEPQCDSNGTVKQVVCTFVDITERKRAEEKVARLAAIVESSDDIIISKTLDGIVTSWNKGAEMIYGYTEAEMVGKPISVLVLPDRADELPIILEKIKNGEHIAHYETLRRRKDGQTVHVSLAISPIQTVDGSIIGASTIGRDITERKVSEELVRDMQRRQSIGILSAGIAHDFNNLLGSMMGNISLAQTQMPAGHPSIHNMENALLAMDRAAHLTQQMLAYAGKGKFQIRTIDVASMISDHMNLFSVSLPKNVALATHLPSVPVFVNGDPGQIEQIIMNLIINGGEAIGDEQGVVSITLTEAAMGRGDLADYGRLTNTPLAEGSYALLEVSDTGMGMGPEMIKKIFDPFFTTKFIGRGLGLSAVLGIIQGHKGGIYIKSAESIGTTFRVILPAVASPVPSEVREITETQVHAEAPTILVIDDEMDIASMAQEILESEQYRVLVKLNPVEGIEIYRQRQSEIDLVLLDLTMPEMTGKEVVDRLKAINPDVKIIVTSGYSEDEVNKKIGIANVSGFIQKPYRLESLISMVGNAIR